MSRPCSSHTDRGLLVIVKEPHTGFAGSGLAHAKGFRPPYVLAKNATPSKTKHIRSKSVFTGQLCEPRSKSDPVLDRTRMILHMVSIDFRI